MTSRRGGRERGSVSIELAILTPAVLALFVCAVVVGRYSMSKQASDAAAFDAARTASLQRNGTTAAQQAEAAARASFTANRIRCRRLDVTVDTSGFKVAVGRPASVTVTVSCQVELKDVALPGVPGTTTLTSTFTSPLDTYRGRSS
ncbi:TadE family protein [Hamadaea tsunoensis]|uniref:TadE family protein n=1 Tax=Hamadaea tsunoensis TaxID=53368 RepID=UPI0003FA8CD2|nr:TadE family protein [Hamadaea tsunoensis]